jgi:hypothetical protein
VAAGSAWKAQLVGVAASGDTRSGAERPLPRVVHVGAAGWGCHGFGPDTGWRLPRQWGSARRAFRAGTCTRPDNGGAALRPTPSYGRPVCARRWSPRRDRVQHRQRTSAGVGAEPARDARSGGADRAGADARAGERGRGQRARAPVEPHERAVRRLRHLRDTNAARVQGLRARPHLSRASAATARYRQRRLPLLAQRSSASAI